MHANDYLGNFDLPNLADVPTIDDTIIAMTLLGRILDELKARLTVAERTVASLQNEKLVLRAELRTMLECIARRPTAAVPLRPAP